MYAGAFWSFVEAQHKHPKTLRWSSTEAVRTIGSKARECCSAGGACHSAPASQPASPKRVKLPGKALKDGEPSVFRMLEQGVRREAPEAKDWF